MISSFTLSTTNMDNYTSNYEHLSIACWNSRGLTASLPYLKKLMQSYDVIALSEHWLHSNRLNILSEISHDFYAIARSSKHAGASEYGYKRGLIGGVTILWMKNLGGISPITSLVHDRVCGVRLQQDVGRVLNIVSVYLPAPGSSEDLSAVLDELSQIIENMEEGSLTMVCGDFNGDVGYLGGPRSTRRPTGAGRGLITFFDEFSLSLTNLMQCASGPLNTFRGAVGSSTIDYRITPHTPRTP